MALILLLGVLGYVNTFDGEFVWDDASSVLLHKHVQDPAKLLQLFREDQHAFGTGQGNFYRPFVSVSFMIDFLISYDAATDAPTTDRPYPAVSPLVFHLTNLAWHLAAALLLFVLLGRLGASPGVRTATSLIFVVHPLHTEAVGYISGRADMMAAAFMFAGLACVFQADAARWMRGVVASALCFAAALLCKESATVFPVLLGILLATPFLRSQHSANIRTSHARRFAPLVVALAVLALYGGLRMTVLRFAEPGDAVAAPLSQRFIEVGQSFALYLRLLFLPTGLHMEQTLAGTPLWVALVGYLLLMAVAAVAVYGFYCRNGRVAAGFAWFLLTWAPISGIFPLNAPLAEHWLYVPMAGFWWGLAELAAMITGQAAGAARTAPLQRWGVPVTAGLTLLFLGLTVARNEAWRSNTAIYENTLASNPETYRIHANLAETYKMEANLAGAQRHYRETLRLYDRFRTRRGNQGTLLQHETYFQWASALLRLGEARFAEGIERNVRYLDALEHCAGIRVAADPRDEDSRTARIVAMDGQALASLALGDFERAALFAREAFLATGDLEGAQAAYEKARRGGAAEEQARVARLTTLLETGSYEEARGRFLAAASYDPPFARLAEVFAADPLFWPNRPENVWRSLGLNAPTRGDPRSR